MNNKLQIMKKILSTSFFNKTKDLTQTCIKIYTFRNLNNVVVCFCGECYGVYIHRMNSIIDRIPDMERLIGHYLIDKRL